MLGPRHSRQLFRRFASLPLFLLFATLLGMLPGAAHSREDEDAKAKIVKKVKVEEEEDPKASTAKKKPIVVEDEPAPPARPSAAMPVNSPEVRLDEVAKAAEQASNPAVKHFLNRFEVPFDWLTETNKEAIRIRPAPYHHATNRFPNEFGIVELDAQNRPLETRRGTSQNLKSVVPFEDLVLGETTRFLQAKDRAAPVPQTVQLDAVETVLAAALRFHDWARDHNKRIGNGWIKVRGPLYDRLREVRIEQLRTAAGVKDSARTSTFAGRLVTLYPKDSEVLREVAAVRLKEAEALLQAGSPAELEKLRDVLGEFETNYPGAGGEVVKRIREELSRRARKMFDDARREAGRNNPAVARNLLRTANALDPDLPGLRDLQSQLKSGYPILYVGVQRLPSRMSPATARFDSEKYAVELLFEGLYDELPDGLGGVTYQPNLAASVPAPTGTGREIALARGAEWNTPDRATARFQAHDVAGTLRLLRARSNTWPGLAAGEWWGERVGLETPGTVRLSFHHAYPDPRAAMTFKLLPSRWLTERNKGADDLDFAKQPMGSGPYKFAGFPATAPNAPGEALFLDSPLYGRRPGKLGQPGIREIRMVERPKIADEIGEMKAGRLHVLPDVPTADLNRLIGPASGLSSVFQGYTFTNHRRVHMLAVNHRRPKMQSKDLRRGLSLAIDREAILTGLFRAGRPELHAGMTGPFPPRSWATPKGANGAPVPLLNRDLALVKLNKYLADGGQNEVTLAVADDDELAKAACKEIKTRVEDLFKDVTTGPKLTISLSLVPPRSLLQIVEEEHRFDLAYVPFDYPDDWYHLGLGSFLDANASERGGRNFLGYLAPGTNFDPDDIRLRQTLGEARNYRDLAGQVAPRAHEIHKLFNEATPFIPLWQLDRHMIFANSVKVVMPDSPVPVSPNVLNPLLLFQGIGRWQLE